MRRGVAALALTAILAPGPEAVAGAGAAFRRLGAVAQIRRARAQVEAAEIIANRVEASLRTGAVAAVFAKTLEGALDEVRAELARRPRPEISGRLGDAMTRALKSACTPRVQDLCRRLKDAIEEAWVPLTMLISRGGLRRLRKKVAEAWRGLP
jgi:hypothetical protein